MSQKNSVTRIILIRSERSLIWITAGAADSVHRGPKNLTSTVSQQIVLHCVPVKLALSNLSVTHVASRKQILF